ncbi:MAG: LysR family transcriptional regulator [Dehalobacterium sp.]
MLNTAYLYYLIQISSCKSMHIAAEKLFVTQPTLSVAIKKLEKYLNTKLLRRTSQGVELTEEGNFVVEQANKAFNYLDNIENHFKGKCLMPNNMAMQEITLFLTPEISNKYAPFLLEEFYKDNKNILITLEEYDTDEICTKLLSNKKALGIVYCAENTQFDENLICDVISKSRAYLRFNKDTRLFPPYLKKISLKEVINIPLIMPQVSDEFHDSLISLVSRYGTPNIILKSPNFYITERMVQDDTAATFYFSVGNVDIDPQYKIIPINNTPRYVLALLYNKDFDSKDILYSKDVIRRSLTNNTKTE